MTPEELENAGYVPRSVDYEKIAKVVKAITDLQLTTGEALALCSRLIHGVLTQCETTIVCYTEDTDPREHEPSDLTPSRCLCAFGAIHGSSDVVNEFERRFKILINEETVGGTDMGLAEPEDGLTLN